MERVLNPCYHADADKLKLLVSVIPSSVAISATQ